MVTPTHFRPVVLTIAGLDPSGGAGIIADIKTIAAFGCFPAAALTSITFQNTRAVFGAQHQTADTIRAQIDPIVKDLQIAATKTGMLPTAEIVEEVVRLFSETDLPGPVGDPVMISTSGHDLIGDEAFQVIKTGFLKVVRLLTPNIPEAERLAGFPIRNEADMRNAAEAIRKLGAAAVLVKGGHRFDINKHEAFDVLLNHAGHFTEFRDEFVQIGEIHGSGCTLSAAIASCLALGMSVEDAVKEAKRYITERIRALRQAVRVGGGAQPI